MIATLVHYWGQVQGVGFRYTAIGIAQGFAVAGFVRNLPDGRVELLAEGESGEVQRFLEAIRRRMAENIESHQESDETVQGRTGFTIRS